MNDGIYTVTSVDDDFCVINGQTRPRVYNAFPLSDGVLISGSGSEGIARLGSSVDGTRPTSIAALVTALRAVIREPERNSLLDAAQLLADGDYLITVTEGVVTFTEQA